MTASVSMPISGMQVGSYEDYAQAQRAVDFLSDEQFPVENVQIVGTDLRSVEQIVGRMTYSRAAMAGAASGAWFGLFVGLLLGIFAPDGAGWLSAILTGLVIGLVFGALFGLAGFAATRGRRDFAAAPRQIVAARYHVLCQPQAAEQARELLARLSLRG